MAKIGRNEPCPCGSGKKYKRCCMGKENKVVDIRQRIAGREFESLHKELSESFTHFEDWLSDFMDTYLENQGLEIANFAEEYTTLFKVWAFFNGQQTGKSQTLFLEFMDKHGDRLRPTVKETVDHWLTVPGMYNVVDHINEDLFVVEKFSTGQRSTVRYEEDVPPEIGNGLVGILVPFAEKESQFLFAFHEFKLSQLWKVFRRYWNNNSGQFERKMRDEFPQILYEIHADPEDPYELISLLNWQTEKHRKVAELFCDMNEFSPLAHTQFAAVSMWHSYCEQSNPRVGKEGVFVAALEYLVTHLEENIVTQKEVAEKYEVSPNSVSKRVQDMDDLLFEVLDQMVGIDELDEPPEFAPRMTMEREMYDLEKAMEGQEFESEKDLQQFLDEYMNNPQKSEKKKPRSKKEQAQELLYDAWDQPPHERVKLAKKALKLYPNSPDAYVILAKEASSLDETMDLYFQGMVVGRRDLGSSFFEENKGHFWGLVETRPFMRAQQGYAETLAEMGGHDLAIEEYRDMLDLNPNDNQGIRYFLLTELLKAGEYKKAVRLIDQYPEPSAQMKYNRAYLEYVINGWSKKTEKLLEEAIEQNPHVPDYLLGKKEIPANKPQFLGIGDENEAIVYVADHAHLWHDKKLMRWLLELSAGK